MQLRPHIALSGNTQWIINNVNHEKRGRNDNVEIIFSLYGAYKDRCVMSALENLLDRADFDWIYTHQGKIRIDADADLASLEPYRRYVPWFKGLLEIEPIIDQEDDSTVVRLTVTEQQIRLATVSGADFSLGPRSGNFRRLITWMPLSAALSWSVISFLADLDVMPIDKLFSASGAVLAVSGGWLELWLWLWQRNPNKQPIQPRELTISMVFGYFFLALGSLIWAYGDRLVKLFGSCS